MKALLFLGLLACAIHGAQAEEFVYDLHPGMFPAKGGPSDQFGFNVRQKGKRSGFLVISLPPDHPWRQIMEARYATGDLPFSYFRIDTEAAIPLMTTPFGAAPHVREAPQPLQAPAPILSHANLKAWSEITQNQFLNITPRKVKPPEDAN